MVETAGARSRPSIDDVAALAGVSRATVSRVVNQQASVGEHLRVKVQAAVDELGYVPNLAARALMTRTLDVVALVASEPDTRVFSDPYFSALIRGVSIEVNRARLQLVLLMAQGAEDLERVKRFLARSPLDAAMLISGHADDGLADELSRHRIPYVIGGRPMDGVAAPYVDSDNVRGAELATAHLLSTGRRRIGTVSGPLDMTAGRDRLQGYRSTMGKRYRPELVEVGDFTKEGGQRAATALLERAPDLDALFAASDLMAIGALTALRRAGRRVPEDVALVGFDDNEWAQAADPALTTVHQDPHLQGRAMVRLLLSRHRPEIAIEPEEGVPDLRDDDHAILPVELVIRESA